MALGSTYDTIFDTNIGQGSYQRIVYFFMGLIALSDEAEILSLSVILPAIKNEWTLSDTKVTILGSVLFIGVFLGSLFVGLASDSIGRRTTLLITSLLQFIFGIASSFVSSFNLFLALRGILGFMIGCTVPIAPTLITEISSTSYRGKAQVCIQAFFVFGMIYAMVLSKIFLHDFSGGNWRAMLALGALPSLFVFIGTLRFVKESPRFLISKGKIDQAVSILNYMGAKNKKGSFHPLTIEERVDIVNWQQVVFSGRANRAGCCSLFNEENRRTTVCLIFNWFGLSFNFFGMVFILPLILESLEAGGLREQGKGIDEFFLTMLGEIPAILIAFLVIDKKFFGRKSSTFLAHVLAGIVFMAGVVLRHKIFLLVTVLARMFTKLAFITINPLTCELYPTNYRTIAMGTTSGIGRIGASIMPFVTMEIYNENTFAPFFIFSGVAFLMALVTWMIPYEPLGRQLDNITKLPEEELKEREKSFEVL